MKIGIISSDRWLERCSNYGTLFQNYALQTFLRSHGHETFWILTHGEISLENPLRKLLVRARSRREKICIFRASKRERRPHSPSTDAGGRIGRPEGRAVYENHKVQYQKFIVFCYENRNTNVSCGA